MSYEKLQPPNSGPSLFLQIRHLVQSDSSKKVLRRKMRQPVTGR